MTRLIDADALLEAMRKEDVLKVYECIKLVNNAPTIQREGWVSVEDRLPENNTFGFGYGYWQGEIHGTDKQKSIEYGEFIDGEIRISGDCYDARLVKISHWFSFELPAAPTETE